MERTFVNDALLKLRTAFRCYRELSSFMLLGMVKIVIMLLVTLTHLAHLLLLWWALFWL